MSAGPEPGRAGQGRGQVLGIETSCDETAAAVVEGGLVVRSSVVSSQVELHEPFGGVVPEIAGRAHVDRMVPVVAEAMVEAGVEPAELDAVAATRGPGLVGALLVGVAAAKALALAWDLPYVGVNHLEAHLYAPALDDHDVGPPMVALLVSGGHTLLVHVEDHGRYRVLGSTVDDAAGEAFDKVARYLGLGYPGGPAIERLAADGDPAAIAFPRAMLDRGYDFSFSGLKTAVIRHVRAEPDTPVADVAASFQAAVVDVLVAKALRAAEDLGVPTLAVGGGVAANGPLRAEVEAAGAAAGLHVSLPSRAMCTDNAAMVAAAGWWQLEREGPSPLDGGADPSLRLVEVADDEEGARGIGDRG